MYAILKTREYQTLSEDIDFLYDINSTNNHRSKNKLAKVTDAVEIRNEHGLRDGFEYLPSGTNNKEVGFTVDQWCSYTRVYPGLCPGETYLCVPG